MKFLAILLDEWRNHIASIENKVSKNLGILYKARTYLNLNSKKQLYFYFIHSYLSYGNIAWASTNKSKLNTLHRRQKHASRIIAGLTLFHNKSFVMKCLCFFHPFQNFRNAIFILLNTLYFVSDI